MGEALALSTAQASESHMSEHFRRGASLVISFSTFFCSALTVKLKSRGKEDTLQKHTFTQTFQKYEYSGGEKIGDLPEDE